MLSMIEDNSGQLWFVSEIALSKFNPDKETFENYQLNSTYQDFNFSEALPVINARHQIVLGTDKGFLEVMPDKMKKAVMYRQSSLPTSGYRGIRLSSRLTIWPSWS